MGQQFEIIKNMLKYFINILIECDFIFQGYDLYPERKESGKPKTNWGRVLLGLEGTENIDKLKCERNVYKCILNSPLIKLMMGALKSSGCEIDIRRHISCEMCDTSVSGGYDPVLNQVVVCQNIAKSEGMVQGVLAHEMIHMYVEHINFTYLLTLIM